MQQRTNIISLDNNAPVEKLADEKSTMLAPPQQIINDDNPDNPCNKEIITAVQIINNAPVEDLENEESTMLAPLLEIKNDSSPYNRLSPKVICNHYLGNLLRV